MYTESVLLESRSLRAGMSERDEALDKVKALTLAPDGIHATTPDVADYFEVSESAVNNLLDRHREELTSNGLRVLRGSELREYQNLKLRLSPANANSYPQRQSQLAVYTRRTVLNVAMLLRDSPVARRVRAHLLDLAAHSGTHTSGAPATCTPLSAHTALATRVGRTELSLSEIGPVLQELGPVIHRMSIRLARVDQRLEDVDRRLEEVDRRSANTDRVVCEMSHRLADMRTDLNQVMREQAICRAEREAAAS